MRGRGAHNGRKPRGARRDAGDRRAVSFSRFRPEGARSLPGARRGFASKPLVRGPSAPLACVASRPEGGRPIASRHIHDSFSRPDSRGANTDSRHRRASPLHSGMPEKGPRQRESPSASAPFREGDHDTHPGQVFRLRALAGSAFPARVPPRSAWVGGDRSPVAHSEPAEKPVTAARPRRNRRLPGLSHRTSLFRPTGFHAGRSPWASRRYRRPGSCQCGLCEMVSLFPLGTERLRGLNVDIPLDSARTRQTSWAGA